MSIAPARRVAFDVIRQVESGRSDLGRALASSRVRLADDRDRALAADLVIGTFRWRAVLDRAIAEHANRPLSRFDPDVLRVLRLAVFQLFYLDRVPERAVVHEAVNQVRNAGRSSAAGLVNAVLRRIARTGRSRALPARPARAPAEAPEEWTDYLSTFASHPQWLVARWMRRWGPEATEAWLAFNNEPSPLTLRATKMALDRLAGAGGDIPDSDIVQLCYLSEDFREGMAAFLEKRPPDWKGR
jgi:16S rRNA (cytosine967-C5)-methyltransferase